jgi:hypothetical protein
MPANNKPWVTIGSVAAGFLALGCCACGGIGYFALMVMARVDHDKKLHEAGEQASRLRDLKEIALAMENCNSAFRRTPANLDELKPYFDGGTPEARIRKGEIEVVWNALPPDQQDAGSSNVLYAWETQPDAKGQRLVVFMDGSARQVSDDEFRSRPKARTMNLPK